MSMGAVVAVLSFVVALAALAMSVIAWVFARAQQRSDRKRAAMLFGNVAVSGVGLYRSIGQIHLSAYASDPGVRAKVDRLIDQVSESDVASTTPSELGGSHPTIADLLELRALIEAEVSAVARSFGISVRQTGTSGLLRELAARELVPRPIAERLLSAIAVANRAVHGGLVSRSEAERAVADGLDALSRIRR